MLMVVAISTFTASLYAVDHAPSDIRLTKAKIQRARNLSSSYVTIAKLNFKKGSKELLEAQKLYADAQAKYGDWASYVSDSIRMGKTRHLNTDPEYDRKASDLGKSAEAFVSYVDSITNGQSKAVDPIFAALSGLGVTLWNDIISQATQQREAAAKDFLAETDWPFWSQISDGSVPTPTPPAGGPAPPTASSKSKSP